MPISHPSQLSEMDDPIANNWDLKRKTVAQIRREVKQLQPPFLPKLLEALRLDGRRGLFDLYLRLKSIERNQADALAHTHRLTEYERTALQRNYSRVAGVDEAGRGPWAGPLVAAAVVLRRDAHIPGLTDSKLLTDKKRRRLRPEIVRQAQAVGVAVVDATTIDRIGIQRANIEAMMVAVSRLTPAPDFVLVDGFELPECPTPFLALKKGDRRSLSIAAASVVAKVTRDDAMIQMHEQYPHYGFARNKGYGTREHLRAIERFGICPAHRRSFAPISSRL